MTDTPDSLVHVWAIEKLLETVLPSLIAVSPNQDQVIADLRALAQVESGDQVFPEESMAAELADALLQRLPTP